MAALPPTQPGAADGMASHRPTPLNVAPQHESYPGGKASMLSSGVEVQVGSMGLSRNSPRRGGGEGKAATSSSEGGTRCGCILSPLSGKRAAWVPTFPLQEGNTRLSGDGLPFSTLFLLFFLGACSIHRLADWHALLLPVVTILACVWKIWQVRVGVRIDTASGER